MDYDVFEGRVLEILYKTSDRVTPQLAAYRTGCSVGQAKSLLEAMASRSVVDMESDERGMIFFELPGRPPASGQPLSWAPPATGGMPANQVGLGHAQGHSMAVPSPWQGYAPQQGFAQQPQWNVPHGHVQSTVVQVYNNMPAMVVIASEKSVGVAVLLALLFGPLGMFYSTVAGALIMMIFGTVIIVGTLGVGILLVVPICMIWAGASASSHNRRIHARTAAAIARS